MEIEKSLLPYINSQFPSIYRENGPLFVAFVQSYMEWLAEPGNTLYKSRGLLDTRDVDTTLPEYINHFQNKYLQGTPLANVQNQPFLIKHVKYLIAHKGTPTGVELFLRLLFNVPSTVYIPGKDVLRASDGVWKQNPYLEVSFQFNNSLLVGKQVIGSSSNATGFVSAFKQVPLPASNRIRDVLVMENVFGTFQVGESVLCSSVNPNPINAPVIIGSLGGLVIEAGGLNFNRGDLLSMVSDQGQHGIATVSATIPRNGVVLFDLVDGGVGYANSTTDPTNFTQTALNITQAPTNPGLGATFEIGELANTFALTLYNDFIYPFISVPLSGVTITSHGTAYANNDVLTFTRAITDTPPLGATTFGAHSIPANDAIGHVSTTNSTGSITAVAITNNGEYTAAPTVGIISTNGTGAVLTAQLNTASLPHINETAYGFTANPTGNGGSTIASCLSSETIVVGTIATLSAVNPGEGYNGDLTINVYSPVIAGMNISDGSGGIDGADAVVTGSASKGEGAVSELILVSSGVGYVNGEFITLSSPEVPGVEVSARATLAGAGIDPGHWVDERGFLDSNKYIQDSFYYQAFSYEVQSALSPDIYDDIIKQSWHAAGTQLFGRVVLEDTSNAVATDDAEYIEVTQ